MSKKQDRGRVRTAHDLERKYNLGGQKDLLKEMQKVISEVKKDISDMQDEDVSTGVISKLVSVFLEPDVEEATAIQKHVAGTELIPNDKLALYDFVGNGDGVKATDARYIIDKIMLGEASLANWERAVKSDVTITIDLSSPENLIKATGTNMWGRDVEYDTGDFIQWVLKDIESNKIKIESLKEEIKALSSNGGSVDEEQIEELTNAIDEINREIETLRSSIGAIELPTNKFTSTVQMFLEPGDEEISVMGKHVAGTQIIPSSKLSLYDFNNSGTVTAVDVRMAEQAKGGLISLADWSGAKKSNVTVTIDMATPEKVVGISGVNMWGRTVELTTTEFIAKLLFEIDSIKSNLIGDIKDDIDSLKSNTGNSGADFITEQGTDGIWTYEKWDSGQSICRAKYSPGSKTFYSLANTFCYNSNSVSFPSGVFASTPTHISITAYCSDGDSMAFCSATSLGKSSVGWDTLLLNPNKDSGSFTVSYFIEVVGSYMVG
ncbi:MAG: hypothetical protein IJA80_02520 [Clostridia bacterium]|nr:hypothetical protein [Clostridia bacterium]